jgi:microcystin-dependent protein
MAQPYVGEIRLFAGNFAPAGWMTCQGQLLPISEYETLFNLIGTTYGGDGQSTFQLPDLQSRIPLHMGTGSGLSPRVLAEAAGQENVTLTINQMPAHTHPVGARTAPGTTNTPAGSLPSQTSSVTPYTEDTATVDMKAETSTIVGGSQPHDNLQPTLALTLIISLFGIFPSPT